MTSLTYPAPLQDGVVCLRPWQDADVACVEQASLDPRIPEGTTVPAQYSPEAGLAFIARQHERLTTGHGVSLAITDQCTNEALGLIILQSRPQEGVAGLGYWIVPDARRRGNASRAISLMSTWGLGDGNFARIEAWVEPDNHASQHVLERNGYLLEGKLRRFLTFGARRCDMLVYSRITSMHS